MNNNENEYFRGGKFMSSFNYTLLPEDFMVSCVWNPIYDMPCTALTEAETVYGAYDRLLGAIEEVYD
jgi:nitrogenase molybdenum-iron protein alpha/beta subunit